MAGCQRLVLWFIALGLVSCSEPVAPKESSSPITGAAGNVAPAGGTGGTPARDSAPARPMLPPDAGPGDAAPADAPLTPDGIMTSMEPGWVGAWRGKVEDLFGRVSTACISITQVTEAGPAGAITYRGDITCDGDVIYESTEDLTSWFTLNPHNPSDDCPPTALRLAMRGDDILDYQAYLASDRDAAFSPETGTLMRVDSCP